MSKKTPLYHIDPDRNEVFIRGKEATLTPKEYKLFLTLESSKKTMTRELLLDHIWGVDPDAMVDTRTLDQHMARLRRKIGTGFITTITGVGFRWDAHKIKK